MQFVRRRTFFACDHQVRGHYPFRQRDMRPLHDGADRDGKRRVIGIEVLGFRERMLRPEAAA
jgi:hypothetical protein